MLGHNTKTLTKVKCEKKVVAFDCILVIYNRSTGFGLFSLSEGLLADKEAHTKHFMLNGTVIAMLFGCG